MTERYGYDAETGEYREPPPPPKPRVEYPTRASLRKQKGGSALTAEVPVIEPATTGLPVPRLDETPAWPVPDHLPDDAMMLPQTGPIALPSDATNSLSRLRDVPSPLPPAAPIPAAPLPTPPAGSPPAAPAESVPAESVPAESVPITPGASRIPRVVAAVVAVIGLVLVTGGILQGTVLKHAATITASLADAPSQPIVVSAPGMLGLNGTRVQVTVSGSARRTVFVGVGRASDVAAYLGNVKRETVTGENGKGVLTAKNEGAEASLPDPGSVDVWKLSQRAKGAAGLSWPNVDEQYVVVAASDGKGAAPARVTFTWSGAKPHSFGAALIAVGAVFLICGLVLLIMLISRARLERVE